MSNHASAPGGPSNPGRANPVVVEVQRGDFVESRHRGAFCVVDAGGDIVLAAGDVTSPIYPRSSLKPLQALALLETGARDRFALDGSHVCLACASHNGESEHTRRVGAWLERIGLSVDDLECGSHMPYAQAAHDALVRADQAPSPLHNNCSGKHAGLLTVARHLGIDHHGYIAPDHPLQQLVTRGVEETCQVALAGTTPAVDGCGIPVYGIPLYNLASAFTGFADRTDGDARARARRVIVEGILAHPHLVAGSKRFCSRVIAASSGAAICKTGAEGVFTGTLLDEGLGFALKIDDGATRASEVLMASLLHRFSRRAAFRAVLEAEVAVTVTNAAGREVGVIRSLGAGF